MSHWIGAAALLLLVVTTLGASSSEVVLQFTGVDGRTEARRFEIRDEPTVREMQAFLDEMLQTQSEQAAKLQARRHQLLENQSLENLTFRELELMHRLPPELLGQRQRRGWAELRRLTEHWLKADATERGRILTSMAEVASASNNTRRAPIPASMEITAAPFLHLDYINSPIARGIAPARNVISNAGRPDGGRIDPPPSSFWKPTDIEAHDLFAGFGRSGLWQAGERMGDYIGPKTGYGLNPGYEVRLGEEEIKVKFGELRSEPFVARIFAALGYNVEPTDYCPALRVRYDRRLLREFNLRRPVMTQVRLLGLPLWTAQFQPEHDPFEFILRAMLKDGRAVCGAQLRELLFHDPAANRPEADPNNFRHDFEQQILFLLTVPANIQVNSPDRTSLGPWNFDRLAHDDLREVRAAGLLAAWLGCFELRVENTRLKLVKSAHESQKLLHYFNDVGSALGRATGLATRTADDPNSFAWVFTRGRRPAQRGQNALPFRIKNFLLVEDNVAFEKMTWDDARWMARKIAKLSENQIVGGLIGAGYFSAEVRLLTEKLLHRRDQMLRDLELIPELPLSRPQGVARKFCYDPELEGPMRAHGANGATLEAPMGDLIVFDGQVRPR